MISATFESGVSQVLKTVLTVNSSLIKDLKIIYILGIIPKYTLLTTCHSPNQSMAEFLVSVSVLVLLHSSHPFASGGPDIQHRTSLFKCRRNLFKDFALKKANDRLNHDYEARKNVITSLPSLFQRFQDNDAALMA